MSKGLSGECPFCHAQSEPGKERFLIRFSASGSFLGYNCFICTKWGKGTRGIRDIVKFLGMQVSFFDINDMALDDKNLNGSFNNKKNTTSILEDSEDGEKEPSPIAWPPLWLNESDEIFLEGVEYLEKRGIKNIPEKIDRFGLKFTTVVDQRDSGDNLRNYPCILAPFARYTDGDVWGWTTRRLRDKDRPSNEPKSIAKSGKGWKNVSLFGIREIDLNKPVVIVEGLFSALSTPNSVALGGKTMTQGQLSELAALESSLYIFALDPDVKRSVYSNQMYQLRQMVPGTTVLCVNWEDYGGEDGGDPNDRGEDKMKEIIYKTIVAKK